MFIYYDVMCDYSQISVCPGSGDKTNIELGWAGLGQAASQDVGHPPPATPASQHTANNTTFGYSKEK